MQFHNYNLISSLIENGTLTVHECIILSYLISFNIREVKVQGAYVCRLCGYFTPHKGNRQKYYRKIAKGLFQKGFLKDEKPINIKEITQIDGKPIHCNTLLWRLTDKSISIKKELDEMFKKNKQDKGPKHEVKRDSLPQDIIDMLNDN